MNLHTKKTMTRHTVTQVPISNHIIQMVQELGAKEGMTGIRFNTRHKKLIWDSSLIAGVDYTPETQTFEEEDDEDWDPEDEEDVDEEDEELQYDTDDDDIPPEEGRESNQAAGPTTANTSTAGVAPTTGVAQEDGSVNSSGDDNGAVDDDADGSSDGSEDCLLYTSPSPRDGLLSRMPSSA